MQINTNGQRNITLDFDAPKKFKLKKDGAEIPYIRTGKNSFRLGRNIDGVLDLEEVIEQPRIVKPMQLQAQQMALVNPNDVLMINQAAQQLEVEQNILNETQKRVEQTQAYLDIQQQRIKEAVLSVQGLETDNSERITATENGIFNLAGELAKVEGNSADADNYIISELDEHKTAENPHGITKETIGLNKVDNTSDLDKPISKAVQSALDEKADKDEIQAIRDELGEYQEKNDRFTNALSNYTGGLAGNQLPDGGLQGQILAKRSDMSGDAEWIDGSVSITVDDELSLESENPVQNKVITLAVNNISDEITAIENKIPAQASSSNQLADKDFVNSSIATNTATFRGTFNSVAELEAYSGEKDNNDYAFVTGVDSLGNTYYDRYKYNGTSWVFEYRLNNSSFTAAQWASINSGATTQSINQISTNTANINSLQTSKQDVISDLATIRSGAALGATAVQPSDLATKQDVLTSENAGTDISITAGTQDVLLSGVSPLALTNALGLNYIKALGATEQSSTPTPDNPVDIVCNNGVLKVNTNLYWTEYHNYQLSQDDGVTLTSNTAVNVSGMVDCSNIKSFKITTATPQGSLRIFKYRTDNTFIDANSTAYIGDTVTLENNVGFFRIQYNYKNFGTKTENVLIYNNAYNLNEVYTDGTQETVNITNGGTANAEMLLKVGNNQDNQELLTGNITRNVGIKVFDGTEGWVKTSSIRKYCSLSKTEFPDAITTASDVICSHAIGTGYTEQGYCYLGNSYFNFNYLNATDDLNDFKQFLAEQYANGTPVIVVYPLATSTTETVTGQSLTASGNCTVTATGSLNNLELEASYKTATGATLISFSNTTGYATESYVDTGLNGKQDTLTQTQLDAVNSGANQSNIAQITANQSNINNINSLIPAQASSANQLADKDFVNSSIATNTATFRGTFNSVAELEVYSGEKDNNDYAFVTGVDSLGNTYFDNYVYNGTAWAYRWRLNNSSFTSAQWAAINSNATAEKIAKIGTNETAINNHIADKTNPHEVTKAQVGLSNVDNTSDLNKPVSTATQTALNGKQDTISDLATIRSGAALGATAVQPADLATVATSGNYNDLSNKPTIPAAQVNSDWNATSGVAQILNKPTIPTVPTNVSAFTNDAGYITSSALNGYATESYVTTAVSGKQDTLVSGTGIDITNDVISVTSPTLVNNTTKGLSILGTSSNLYNSTSIGKNSSASGIGSVAISDSYGTASASGLYGTCVGGDSSATGTAATAFGSHAKATANYAIQLGYGTNSEANTFYVATSTSNNWKMLGSDGKIPSDRISIDGTTITVNSSGQLQASGGGGSSYTAGTGIDITNDVISVTSAISTGAALGATALQPSALNGYATQAWVGQQGYITSITSSDVTTALGYTPYNSSNPSGYITSAALTPYVLSEDLATVATSGSYNDLSNKPTIPTVNNPTITFTQGGTTKGTITLNQSTNQTVALDAGGGARNIGEIIQSTIPLSDAGLHLLDGSVISGDGIYSEFYNFIGSLVNTYPQIFCQEHEWQAEVASHGVCGKFVFYEPNRTVRLPKMTGFIEGTIDLTALGVLTQAGVPNITGGFGGNKFGTASGAFSYNNTTKGQSSGDDYEQGQVTFDASRSSSIYGNSNTVQPQSIKVLFYICIATSTKTDIQVDIDEIATDLNGKADIDLSNINPTSAKKAEITSWGMPNYTSGVSKSANVDYTADSNGFIIAVPTAQSGESKLKIKIDDIEFMFFQGYTNTDYEHLSNGCIPIAKNSTYRITLLSGCNVRFFPCIGG